MHPPLCKILEKTLPNTACYKDDNSLIKSEKECVTSICMAYIIKLSLAVWMEA